MKLWVPKATKTAKENNNRVNIVMAIVFLLAGTLIARLFYLQVIVHDYYTKIADNQHVSSRSLEPSRGRIFISDAENKDKIFPLATNKEFAVVFAQPKYLVNADLTSRQLYYLFDRDKIRNDVEANFAAKKAEMTKSASTTAPIILTDAEEQMLSIQKNDELKNRREQVVKTYFDRLNNKADSYEPIAEKVDDEHLMKIYAAMTTHNPLDFYPNDDGTDKSFVINADGLIVRSEEVWRLKTDGDEVIKIPGISFANRAYRFYPEKNIGAHLLGFVGYNDGKMKGNYGLEGFFNEELTGKPGSVKAERGAGGGLIIVNDRQYVKPVNGSDLFLTIDRSIQFNVCAKLAAAVMKHGADSGSVIVMDPKTGAILAMCNYPDFDPNNYKDVKNIYIYNNETVFAGYEPGSIFKVMTMAMGLDMEVVTPDTTYTDTGAVTVAGFTMMNSDKKANGVQTMTQVLEKSLNTGVIFVTKKVGFDNFNKYMDAFGFGEKFGIELQGENQGTINSLYIKKNADLYHYNASFGQGIRVTPLQMAAAFSTIANGGVMMKPYIVKEIVNDDGSKTETQPIQMRRVISERAASLLGGMLVNVIENGHGKRAGVKGYYVGGKTGTAQVPRKDGKGYEAGNNIGSFAGYAPIDDPKFAMVVRLDHPRDVDWAESSAAPLFGEIAEFMLNYYKVPPVRTDDSNKKLR